MNTDLRGSCIVNVLGFCNSDLLDHFLKLAKEKCDLNRVIESILRAYPGGVLKEWRKYYRMGDSFDRIDVLPINTTSLKIEFHVKKDAVTFWKDLAVGIITELDKLGLKMKSIKKKT